MISIYIFISFDTIQKHHPELTIFKNGIELFMMIEMNGQISLCGSFDNPTKPLTTETKRVLSTEILFDILQTNVNPIIHQINQMLNYYLV